MAKNTRFVGLDVHAETIAVAVAEGRNQVRSLGTIANRPEAVRRLLGKLGKLTEVKVCYEAGPTGYALYWELTRLGVQCEVIAPSLVPMKSGDRIKTDRRDAERLARSYQAGDLTAVWSRIPSMKLCATWFEHEKRRKRTNCARSIDCSSTFCATGSDQLTTAVHGPRRGGSGCALCGFHIPSRMRRCSSWSSRLTIRASASNASILLSTKPSLPRPSNCEPSSMRCKLCEGSPK